MISVNEAWNIIVRQLPVKKITEVSLLESLDSTLAEDVFSDLDLPPFDKSAMDGYALRAADIKNAPVELEIIEVVSAGQVPVKAVKPGKTIKIMTGAPIPQGADTVVRIEDTEAVKNNTVRVLATIKKGANIAYQAEELKEGAKVLSKDTFLRSQEIGVLASVGKQRLKIYQKPTVAIISTGDELVEINVKPQPAQIRNSNSYTTAGQIAKMGLNYELLGIARDNLSDLTEKISRGLQFDILVLTGGVSVGEFDLVEQVLKKLGVKLFFDQVAIKPGKPFVFGKKEDHLVFALPGNPVSSFVITEVFIRPAVSMISGNPSLVKPKIFAKITEPFQKITNRQQYVPAVFEQQTFSITPVHWHGSADLVSVTHANALLIIPPNITPLKQDDQAEVMLLE
ncbi:MAG: gephyrin-like molybdotransferase Glp [Planctomycetota bacterium]